MKDIRFYPVCLVVVLHNEITSRVAAQQRPELRYVFVQRVYPFLDVD